MNQHVTKKARRAANATAAIIYVRVSSDEQVKSGLGIDAQITECTAYAERQGYVVIEVVIEDAISGKVHPSKRPGFQRVLGLLEGCTACVLVVRRQDRLSRNLRHTLDVVAAAVKSGWSIDAVDGKLNTATAAGKLHINLMASIAEYERELIGERTKEALQVLKTNGVVLGQKPELDAAVVRRIVTERAAGKSIGAIAGGLTEDGFQAARGGPFTRSGVQAVLISERVARGDY